MRVHSLRVKQFRCFDDLTLTFDGSKILIIGPNGSGKTSLLEALHFLCYLRSFKTYIPRELIHFATDSFFLHACVEGEQADDARHDVQVGVTNKRRSVRVDGVPVQSFKELMPFYRAVTMTEEDIQLVKGGPEGRRAFIDQALVLANPVFIEKMRALKTAVDQRAALLHNGSFEATEHEIWTRQLWDHSCQIALERSHLLEQLAGRVNETLVTHFADLLPGVIVELTYKTKTIADEPFEQFFKRHAALWPEEARQRRSLFGAHLDDFSILFATHVSRLYASRGQQKLIAVLLKLAVLQELLEKGGGAVLLLDDFMTDFDRHIMEKLLGIISSLRCQLVVTCPDSTSTLQQYLLEQGAQVIKLTHRKIEHR